jgi:hypothetical protein
MTSMNYARISSDACEFVQEEIRGEGPVERIRVRLADELRPLHRKNAFRGEPVSGWLFTDPAG